MKNFNLLKQKYLEILSQLDESFLNQAHKEAKHHKKSGLSGVFIPSEPKNYWNSKNRIMIIGAETRDWEIKLEDEYNLEKYISASIEKHQIFFQSMLTKPRTKKITFHDFSRAVADQSGQDGLLYCNLFCFSWKMKSPIKSKYFEEIKSVSYQLLQEQIDYFEPEIIIFANGSASTPYRRELFLPVLYSEAQDYIDDGILKNQLLKFFYDKKYLCYRIQHPSTIRGKRAAIAARKKLIKLLPNK